MLTDLTLWLLSIDTLVSPLSCYITCVSYIQNAPIAKQSNFILRINEHITAIDIKNLDYATSLHYVKANHGPGSSVKFWCVVDVLPSVTGLLVVQDDSGFMYWLSTTLENKSETIRCLSDG